MSSGVAYTLQIVGQKGMNPTVASLILSLEAVVSVLAGFVMLDQQLTMRETMGCAFMVLRDRVCAAPAEEHKKR